MEYGVVVRWWLLFQVLLVVGLPFAARVLPDAPDRGASLAMPTALVLLTVPLLWVGQLAFGLWVVVAVALLVLAASAWLARGGIEVDARAYAEVVTVFTVAFLFLLAIRAAADGVHPFAGEKFLDFGLLQSLLRADRLPPQDMWFAGERVVYYYGGHLMAAAMSLLTGTQGRFAYSPALAGFYAMAVTGAYGLASTIAASTTGEDEDETAPVRGSTALAVAGVVFALALLATGVSWYLLVLPAALAAAAATRSRRVRAGVLAAFVFGFASNLLTPVRLLAGKVGLVEDVVVAAGLRENLAPTITPESFDSWHASRVIDTAINEFPLFAYLNGDLHGHMMDVAVLFLVAGVALAYYRTPAARARRRAALLFGAMPLLAATILAVNTWSFPTVLGVTALTVALADPAPHTLVPARFRGPFERGGRVGAELQRVAFGVGAAVVVAVVSLAVVWPFVWNVLLLGAGGRSPELFPQTSRLGSFLLVHGLFLVSLGAYLVARAARDRWDWVLAGIAVLFLVTLAATFDLVVAGVSLDFVGLALGGPLVAGGWLLRRRSRVGFEGVLVVAGAGLVVLVEYVYLADNASPERFNTVFKVYAQAWAFWSVAAGVALASLARRRVGSRARLRSAAGTTLVAVLLVSASIYGGLALTNHFGQMDDPTIDAMEYVHDERPGEAAAIEWLLDKPGQPHLVSAPGLEPYSWQNPESSLTGIPTVAGWIQETIYRGEEAYYTRVDDVQIIFETEDPVSRAVLLRKHEVDYIWVGPVEQERYDVANVADEPGISIATVTPTVTVYAVNRTELVETEN